MIELLRTLVLSRRPSFMITVGAILAGTSYLYWKAAQLPPPLAILNGYPGDGFFPRITLTLVFISGIISLVRELRVSETAPFPNSISDNLWQIKQEEPIYFDLLEVFLILFYSLTYVTLLVPLGLELATTIFVFALLFPRLLMPWHKAALVSAVGAVLTTIFVYVLFVIGLDVALPLKIFPRFLEVS